MIRWETVVIFAVLPAIEVAVLFALAAYAISQLAIGDFGIR